MPDILGQNNSTSLRAVRVARKLDGGIAAPARYSFNRNPLVMRGTQSAGQALEVIAGWASTRRRCARRMSGSRKEMVSTTAEALTR